MTEDRIVGSAKQLGGKAEEALGRFSGDTETQARGMARQAEGAFQEVSGQVKATAVQASRALRAGASEADDYVRHTIETRPYLVAAVALGLGFILGRLAGRG